MILEVNGGWRLRLIILKFEILSFLVASGECTKATFLMVQSDIPHGSLNVRVIRHQIGLLGFVRIAFQAIRVPVKATFLMVVSTQRSKGDVSHG